MAGLTREDFDHWVRTYYNHPEAFVVEVLGGQPYPWQRDALQRIALGDRNVAIRSGHRVGKSTFLAWLCLWYMLTRTPFKIGVTAPTAGQLYDAMYAELKTWYQKLPSGLKVLLEIKSDRVDLVGSAGASFLTLKTGRVDQPEALAGLHSPNTLLIGDEASGIADSVFESSTSSMAAPNAQMILTGNPLRGTGYFAMCFGDWSDTWTLFTESSINCLNVSRAWIEEKKREYGEESNAYRARVLGLPPRGDDDTIIPLETVLSAVGRDVAPLPNEPEVWGLDVAELGSCVSALVRRRPLRVPMPADVFAGLEAMQLVGRVAAIYESIALLKRPTLINVDGIGYGAGVASRLAELGLPAVAINVAETPPIGGPQQIYYNQRTELWYKAREWFQSRNVTIPKDDRLIADLTKIRLAEPKEGRQQLLLAESKKSMRKRGVVSPDVGDAFVLTFAGNPFLAANRNQKYRGKPIRRRIKGTTYT